MEKSYDIVETAKIIGAKARTIRQWIYEGKLKATKIQGGRKWVIMESEIRRLRGEYENKDRKHTEGDA